MMHCMTVGDGRKWVKRPEGLGKLWCQSSREISTGQTTMTGVLPAQIPKDEMNAKVDFIRA